MKIIDWKNEVSKAYYCLEHKNINDLMLYMAPQDLYLSSCENLLKQFYSTYIFNSEKKDIVIASSVDGVNFSGLDYVNGSIDFFETKDGGYMSMIDAGMGYIKSTNNRNSIKDWEDYYLGNFISEKLSLEQTPQEVINNYIGRKTKLNIDNITEGYVSSHEFDSFYTISKNESDNPYLIVFIGSKDGKYISSHFSLQYDKSLSKNEYEKILEKLNLPSLENNQ